MVFCEVCNINISNMSRHIKTKKHQNSDKTNAMNEGQLKEYHKKYKEKKIDDLEPNVEKYIKELTNIENPLMQYYIDELDSAIKEMKSNISI
jgi:hypothetical protein